MQRAAFALFSLFLAWRGLSAAEAPIVLKPDRVFDGMALEPHEGWVVVVRGDKIEGAGPAAAATMTTLGGSC